MIIGFEAVNGVIIILKDHGEIKSSSGLILPEYQQQTAEVPPPYTGVIDSVCEGTEWCVGDRVAFCDVGGLYMQVDDKEYVVVLPEMIVGKLC